MANFVKTFSASIRIFGEEPTSKWGTALFGTALWGWGTEDITVVINPFTDFMVMSDLFIHSLRRTISNSIGTSFEMSSEELKDSSGYEYVFTRPTTEAELAAHTTYSNVNGPGTSWAPSSMVTTIWS